ncbi:hypothetical protein Mapa_013296 [Marchantia paleacea]|nr:hypothetical protein Mapa_013296 [Marchantia paleacea]
MYSSNIMAGEHDRRRNVAVHRVTASWRRCHLREESRCHCPVFLPANALLGPRCQKQRERQAREVSVLPHRRLPCCRYGLPLDSVRGSMVSLVISPSLPHSLTIPSPSLNSHHWNTVFL